MPKQPTIQTGWRRCRFNFSTTEDLPEGFTLREEVGTIPDATDIYSREQIGAGCYRAAVDFDRLDQN